MTDGTNGEDASDTAGSASEMAGRLNGELRTLLRQRDQYALALDTAADPKISIRLQRTLERLEEEVEVLQEAINALPEGGTGDDAPTLAPQAAPPEPPEPSAPQATQSQAVPAPDWEEEPATSIYDPSMLLPDAAAPAPASAVPVAIADLVPEPDLEPPVSVEDVRKEDAAAANAAALHRLRKGDPLGPVVVDALEPPTGEMEPVRTERVPEETEAPRTVVDTGTQHGAPEPAAAPVSTPVPAPAATASPAFAPAAAASPAFDADDPFALPGQAPSVSSASGAGFPAAAPVDFAAGSISVLDDEGSGEWSGASKFLLALVIAAFLGGVFYVFSI